MPTESLILRRVLPVPVTFADLRAAYDIAMRMGRDNIDAEYRATRKAMARGEVPPEPSMLEDFWHAAIKDATGAIDEVYAVIDGREVRVAIASSSGGVEMVGGPRHIAKDIADLLIKADEQGYWERPHEVVHVLEERAISRRAVDLACGVSPDRVGA